MTEKETHVESEPGMSPRGVELRPASEMLYSRTTCARIAEDFRNGVLPLYYHTYNEDAMFVATHPRLLEELFRGTGNDSMADELRAAMQESYGKKVEVFEKIRRKTKERYEMSKMQKDN